MTIRHYAIALAALVLAIPLLAMMFLLLPVLLPLALAVPFLVAACARQTAQPDGAVTPVAEPVGRLVSIDERATALVPRLRPEVGSLGHSRAA